MLVFFFTATGISPCLIERSASKSGVLLADERARSKVTGCTRARRVSRRFSAFTGFSYDYYYATRALGGFREAAAGGGGDSGRAMARHARLEKPNGVVSLEKNFPLKKIDAGEFASGCFNEKQIGVRFPVGRVNE